MALPIEHLSCILKATRVVEQINKALDDPVIDDHHLRHISCEVPMTWKARNYVIRKYPHRCPSHPSAIAGALNSFFDCDRLPEIDTSASMDVCHISGMHPM